ncbi:MAG: enoyl-ACP reductase [Clostridiaceae bacterium]|nr:enoyl-ACP reductase [Clostridiaceae bacterium]
MLTNKNIIIMGVRNKWSIAWGIAQSCLEQNANIILTYRGERERESIEKLVQKEYASKIRLYACDVSSDDQIQELFNKAGKDYGILHGLVHAVAHANTDDLRDSFINTSREGFLHAMDISAYSLIAVSRYAKELMKDGGSIITLTYQGSNRVVLGYNVMGVAKAALESSVRYLAHDLGLQNIRINAISAGPVKTVSAMGIQNFGDVLDIVQQRAPLKRNITLKELGNIASCLLSDHTMGITGQIIYADSGFSILGM